MRKFYLAGVCLILAGCGSKEQATPAAPASIAIERLEPSSTAEAKAFHARVDGQSVLVVFGTDIPQGATVEWNDQPMASSGGGKVGWVEGVIPASLYQTAGMAKVTVRSGDTVSNPLDFTIYGKTGPAPQVSAVAPAGAVAGKGFNVQPNGDSALGVGGTDFLPGVAVVVDGKQMNTVFNSGTLISAVIPGPLVASAGSHQVWVANPDGKTSNKVTFKVSAQ